MKIFTLNLQKTLLFLMPLLVFSSNAFAVSIPSCTPGLCTIKNFLSTAIQPIGSTMYVWAGGWDETESKPGIISTKIGVLPQWKEFYQKQTEDYNFKNYCLPIKNKEGGSLLPEPKSIEWGLDCSGFVGWVVYNIINIEDYRESFVYKARVQAKVFDEKHRFGEYKDFGKIIDIKPGDIISISTKERFSHVYISLFRAM